ncbi:hypothetical protein D3C87_162760 [compost metagenome]
MKSSNLFPRVFIALSVLTIVFLSAAGYSFEKAHNSDPQLVQRLEERYNIRMGMGGVSKSMGKEGERAQDTWTEALPTDKITITTISGKVEIKTSPAKEIQISAKGKLDTSLAPRLLDVSASGGGLSIRQPDNDAVTNLEVEVLIPESYAKDLDIQSVSSDLSLRGLTLNTLDIKAVSGDAKLKNMTAQTVDFKTVSGDIEAENSTFTKVSGKTVSGDFDLATDRSSNMDINSTSGDVKLKIADGKNTQFTLKSMSGKIENIHNDIKSGEFKISISTISGDIEVE